VLDRVKALCYNHKCKGDKVMAHKRKKRETIKVMDSIEKSLMDMEKFNPYQCGNGVWVSEKYKTGRKGRRRDKLRKEIREYE
jgi:hypothetical protein